MNLTAEQICDLKQEICEDNGWMRDAIPQFHAICDMAKRTLAAEKELEKALHLNRDCLAELISLKSAALKHDIATQEKADGKSAPAVAAPDLVERLRKYNPVEGQAGINMRDALLREAAAALAEREKDAERYRYLREPREKMNDGRPFIAIAHIGGSGFSGWDETHADAQVDRAIADALRSRS